MHAQERSVYNPLEIETRWLEIWEKRKLFYDIEDTSALEALDDEDLYILFAFAYPSGSGLHVGHVESLTALDILVRYYRMHGKNVLFPPGWDAFGLPAENYAIKSGIHPAVTTNNAIETFEGQVRRVGISYNWNREIATHQPEYYKWTQWFFQQLYKDGLAYRDTGSVNWCPKDQTVLANEQVVKGCCERCGTEVIQKEMPQWYFKITQYQDALIDGLDTVDWPESTAKQQKDWIGRQEGAQVLFQLEGYDFDLACFTTRLDTIQGVTFVVIAPEKLEKFGLLEDIDASKIDAVQAYLEQTRLKTEEDRKIGEKNKTGIDTGLRLLNPVNGDRIPLYVADYVLANYGTGVVMGVPAHDKRDFDFATQHGLEVKQVITDNSGTVSSGSLFEDQGILVNSGEFDGMTSGEAVQALFEKHSDRIEPTTSYRLRDWLVSRQRYWGAPIPVVYDPDGNPHLVKEEHLPWLLPEDVDFLPHGESPLARSQEFIRRTEKLYGKGWRPEFDTMDTFVDSSWYFERFTDPHNDAEFASTDNLNRHLPVDFYMIGAEHTVLHLLYSRFFTKYAHDKGWVDVDEPFQIMRHQGTILGPDGLRMAKSRGNVVNPDDVINEHGADSLRMYEMFMGPLHMEKAWDKKSIIGVYKFLSRVYALISERDYEDDGVSDPELRRELHQTIKKVTEDIPELKFNTAISAMMAFIRTWGETQRSVDSEKAVLAKDDSINFVKILAPFAPFMACELYAILTATAENPEPMVHLESWPAYDEELIIVDEKEIPVQLNGRIIGRIMVPLASMRDEEKIRQLIEESPDIQAKLSGRTIVKQRIVPGRIVAYQAK